VRPKLVVEEYTQDKYENKNVAFRTVITLIYRRLLVMQQDAEIQYIVKRIWMILVSASALCMSLEILVTDQFQIVMRIAGVDSGGVGGGVVEVFVTGYAIIMPSAGIMDTRRNPPTPYFHNGQWRSSVLHDSSRQILEGPQSMRSWLKHEGQGSFKGPNWIEGCTMDPVVL
jgi:hypothetical protein